MSNHGHSHIHDLDGLGVARSLRFFVGGVAILTLVGLVVLWPRGSVPDLGIDTTGLEYVNASVGSTGEGDCLDVTEGLPTECQKAEVLITSGSTEGDSAIVQISRIDFSAPTLETGDKVVLLYNDLAPAEFSTPSPSFSAVVRWRSSPLPSQ